MIESCVDYFSFWECRGLFTGDIIVVSVCLECGFAQFYFVHTRNKFWNCRHSIAWLLVGTRKTNIIWPEPTTRKMQMLLLLTVYPTQHTVPLEAAYAAERHIKHLINFLFIFFGLSCNELYSSASYLIMVAVHEVTHIVISIWKQDLSGVIQDIETE